ncbi:MAG: type II secretion system F family protein [Phycisphaerales bacterium]|nr:type II secretion system F family protein [Phycisphaerales bacterium]
MGTFAYIARDPSGTRVSGRLAGASEQAVLAELHARRLAPLQVTAVREVRSLRRGVSIRVQATAYRQLADLLRAGVPLLRALRLLGRGKSNPPFAAVWMKIADAVADGTRLGDAMAAHPDVFPAIQLAMIRAGERGGFLEQVLARMATFLDHQAEMRSKVVGSSIYPLALLVVSTLVVVGALVFFVPKFKDFYAKIEVPLPTRIVMGISDALTGHALLLGVGLAVVVAGVLWLRRRPRVRRLFAEYQLKIPKLGPLVRNLAVARFTRILGTLLENGIPLLTSMQIARDAAGHIVLAEAIDEATEAVRAGETLAGPLGSSGMLSDDVLEMIAVGESANNLPAVLTTIADTIEGRIDRMLTILVRLLEPLLLLGLGGIITFIFIALVVPMMKMGSSL